MNLPELSSLSILKESGVAGKVMSSTSMSLAMSVVGSFRLRSHIHLR